MCVVTSSFQHDYEILSCLRYSNYFSDKRLLSSKEWLCYIWLGIDMFYVVDYCYVLFSWLMLCFIWLVIAMFYAGPSGRAVYGVGLRPPACCDRGFESYRGHGCLSVVCVVCCQVEVAATSLSLVQRSPTNCGASFCVITKPRERGGHSPRWAAVPEKIIIIIIITIIAMFYLVSYCCVLFGLLLIRSIWLVIAMFH
jgi:hypothetical protein